MISEFLKKNMFLTIPIMAAAFACQLCWQYPGISSQSGLGQDWVLLRQMWYNICIAYQIKIGIIGICRILDDGL